MGRPKSLLKNVSVTEAKKSHKCRHDDNRTIRMGEPRLTVKEGRNVSHYCLENGQKFLELAFEKVSGLLQEVKQRLARDKDDC